MSTEPPAPSSSSSASPGGAPPLPPAGAPPLTSSTSNPAVHDQSKILPLAMGALGVVYGDIGTSPLYSLKECLAWPAISHAVRPEPDAVLGVLSLVLWSMLLVVVVKYLSFVMRADNKGEGGILALAALVPPRPAGKAGLGFITIAALLGAGLLYGDGIITPAISVLGAVEGLGVATHALEPAIVPIALAILVGLFAVQRHGTHRIGRIFGWVMLVWFVVLGVEGVLWMVKKPEVLTAINPVLGVEFLLTHHWHGFLLLGSVFLVVTGGEALYADMGHFGRRPIRIAWYAVVMPGLTLNYFGQGALFLIKPIESVKNPFFELVEGPWIYPQVILATLAAIIASQALISGAFSLTRQAVQLGYLPRVTVTHTSAEHEGQIYIPEVNGLLMIGCLALVAGFGSSTKLAAAYGIAVTGTMAITTLLFYQVARHRWGWRRRRLVPLVAVFLVFDLAFLAANAAKIHHGGWFPLAIGAGALIVMMTWWRGRRELAQALDSGNVPDELFFADLRDNPVVRVRGTAVFMTSSADAIPNVLLHHLKHNQVLHKQVVLLSLQTQPVPWVQGSNALELTELEHGFFRVIGRVGFMQSSDVPRLLQRCASRGIAAEPMTTTYYLGRQTLLTRGRVKMARWRKKLFAFLLKNSKPPTDFFNLPPNRVVELGVQIEL